MGLDLELANDFSDASLIEGESDTVASEEGGEFGLVPIILPHKNRARYIIKSNEVQPNAKRVNNQYQVIEFSHSTLLAGVLAYANIGPIIGGLGAITQLSRDFSSSRLVSSRDEAYLVSELYPPRSLDEVLAWPEAKVSISYYRLRGLKLAAGLYAVAHAGNTYEIEGIWSQRVIKDGKKISVSLALKIQRRLKFSIGVAPISANNFDIIHGAKTTELTFHFQNIEENPAVKKILSSLIESNNASVVIDALVLAESEKNRKLGKEAPIIFSSEKVRFEHDDRRRFRLRIPLLRNLQKVQKKRDRTENLQFNHNGVLYKSKQTISEVIHRRESQKTMDFIRWNKSLNVYPNRLRFSPRSGFNWPVDYRNKKLERITKIIKSGTGDLYKNYDESHVCLLWQHSDNYISHHKFTKILEKFGRESGLQPILYNAEDIPEFLGTNRENATRRESMLLSLQVFIRGFEIKKVNDNVLDKSFINRTLELFDKYLVNKRGDYLGLARYYRSAQDFKRIYRKSLEKSCYQIQSKAFEKDKLFKLKKKSLYLGLYTRSLTLKDKMHLERELWELLRQNPFAFLSALEGASPACTIKILGTSVNLERNIEISLARDIMCEEATIPFKYQKNHASNYLVNSSLNNHRSVARNALIETEWVRYYSDEFINFLVENKIKNVVVVVSSWSDGAMVFPRSAHIGSRQSRDLPHHLVLAQRLKRVGVFLKIYYLAFDNTLHFNKKDKRSVDNTILPAFKKYILSFDGESLFESQLETIYLNPQYIEKEGDLVIEELAPVMGPKGNCLSFTGKNAIEIKRLKQKIAAHRQHGDYVLGMTAHSAGRELDKLSDYLFLKLIGCSNAALKYGSKDGNKVLFSLANVPFVRGTKVANKSLDGLIKDCFVVACDTKCRRLMIKHNSSSAGKGNLIINIENCYDERKQHVSFVKIKEQILKALYAHRHPVKDAGLQEGAETFYIRKIRELGAIVEEMIEADRVVSPGTLATVLSDGKVEVEYIYDQVLNGKDEQNFGGSLGPSLLDESDVQEMTRLNRIIGKTLYQQGFIGYFGLDFLKCDDKPLIVIEANLRKTGTRYPYMLASHLIGEKTLKHKHLFHDDNIELPVGICDLPGRNFALQHYISSLYNWFSGHMISYSRKKGVGAIISFDTHSVGKLGVLTIGNSREQALDLSRLFREALQYFNTTFYPTGYLQKHFYGLNLANSHLLRDDSLVINGISLIKAQRAPLRNERHLSSLQALSFFSNKLEQTANKLPKLLTNKLPTIRVLKDQNKSISMLQEFENYNPETKALFLDNQDRLVFVLYGRTRTSDYLLLKAAAQGIYCYRMTEDSELNFDPCTGKGSVTRVSVPLLDKRTNQYKVYFDQETHYFLPTVIYNYDFSAARRLYNNDRGSRIYFDNHLEMQSNFARMNVRFINDIGKSWQSMMQLNPLRSQLAFSHVLENYEPELFNVYPETLPLESNQQMDEKILEFIAKHQSFYVKRSLSAHEQHNHQTKVYINKEKGGLLFSYFVEANERSTKLIQPKFVRLSLQDLTAETFLDLLNVIKTELGVADNVQYVLQEDLESVSIMDVCERALRAKLRIVSLHSPETGKLISTSCYGVYGGENAYLGYLGAPAVYLSSAQQAGHFSHLSHDELIGIMRDVAIKVHQVLEKSMDAHFGEVVTDIVIGRTGIIPLKASIKPERLNLEFIRNQTYFGHYLEGDKETRELFLSMLEHQESERSTIILQTAERLHKQRESIHPELSLEQGMN